MAWEASRTASVENRKVLAVSLLVLEAGNRTAWVGNPADLADQAEGPAEQVDPAENPADRVAQVENPVVPAAPAARRAEERASSRFQRNPKMGAGRRSPCKVQYYMA